MSIMSVTKNCFPHFHLIEVKTERVKHHHPFLAILLLLFYNTSINAPETSIIKYPYRMVKFNEFPSNTAMIHLISVVRLHTLICV